MFFLLWQIALRFAVQDLMCGMRRNAIVSAINGPYFSCDYSLHIDMWTHVVMSDLMLQPVFFCKVCNYVKRKVCIVLL